MLIKQICNIVNGSTPSTSCLEFWDGDISWITPKDMSLQTKRYISKGERNITEKGYNSCSTTLVPRNTILLTSRAPIGYISIAENELCTNQGFKSLVCGDKVLPLFMYYWLATKVDLLKSISNGATFKELSKQALENVEIDLPNLEIQQHIVDTIGSVDDLIEKCGAIYDRICFYQQKVWDNFIANSDTELTTLEDCILKANTGADAIQKAPIVNFPTNCIPGKQIQHNFAYTSLMKYLYPKQVRQQVFLPVPAYPIHQ